MIRLGSLAGYPFEGPRLLAGWTPPPAAAVYDLLYAEYVQLHDYFGRGANEVMHRLRALRDRVLGEPAGMPR